MATVGFLSDDDLREDLGATLHKAGMDLPPETIVRLVPRANAMAWADIRTVLAARGLSAAEILTWSDGAAFQASQGLFWALTLAAGADQGIDDKFVNKLDRRAELASVILLNDEGVEIVPAGDPRDIVGFGVIKHHRDLDQFTRNDGRRGGAGSFRGW